jgi:hypothetical protein
MTSAFGIEHGEFSKARRARQKPPSQARLTLGEAGRKVSSTRVSLTDIGTATGKGVSGVGNVLRAKPGLTGAAVVSGAGYSLYRVNNKKKAPKGM